MHKKMKYVILIGIICVVLGILLVWGMLNSTKTTIECYFYDPCGGCFTDTGPCKPCTVETRLGHQYMERIAHNGLEDVVDLKLYNVLYEVYKQKYETRLQQYNLTGQKRNYPIIFIGNTYLIGESEIESKMISTIDAARNPLRRMMYFIQHRNKALLPLKKWKYQMTNENCVVYFSVPYCADCKRVKEYLETLKQEEFKNNDFRVISYSIDAEEDFNLFKLYCQLYEVRGNETVVPAVFVGDEYLEGYEQISRGLKTALIQGQGNHTKVIRVGADD